jgi:FemAB-related protein (PEP-CTERM system-associated)
MTIAATEGTQAVRRREALGGVRQLDSIDDEARWDAFVRGDSQGTFFHLSGWRRLVGDVLGHTPFYLYVERAGQIEGVLPLARIRSWLFGDALISLPHLVYGGPLAQTDEAMNALVNYSIELAEDLGVGHIELRNQNSTVGDWVTGTKYATFRKSLDPDPEKNFLAIPRKQRAVVRKGIQLGLQAEIDESTNRLYSAMLVCKRNLGTPFFGPRWLREIKKEFGDDAEITTITHEGQTVCSVMSFRYGDEILPYYGGGGELARTLKGNDFMYWAVMERACKEGVKIFDYGRSMEGSGAYRFKKHWGFEPEPLHYQYRLVDSSSLPDLNPANPRYRRLIDIWKRLPLSIAGTIGPPLARRLG